MANGRAILVNVATGRAELKLISLEDLSDAIYYLDGSLFTASGTGKAVRAVRAEAKRRGVL